ncbi:MAG TPA: DinB family protein [Terriglobales bacterium]|nr:DinB family protein [Terriglobales bacterium]
MSTPVTHAKISPQLAAIADELNAVNDGWKQLASQVEVDKVWQRPAKGGWSVGECLDHLTTTTRQMLPAVKKALSNGPKGGGPYKMDLKGKLLVWFMEPPYRMKFKAVPNFQPHQTEKDPLREFLQSQEEALDVLRRCNGLDLNKLKIVSPVDARMSYNAYAALKLLPAHQRRHLWQAQQIVKHL